MTGYQGSCLSHPAALAGFKDRTNRIIVGLYDPGLVGILGLRFSIKGAPMHSSSPSRKWTPYETKATLISCERRSEDSQLERLTLRLRKQMQEAEDLASEPAAA